MGIYRLIIATDFDGTLCEEQWPSIGAPNIPLINYLLDKKKKGCIIILNTCREGEELEEAVKWCKSYGLEFDAVNDNCQQIKDTWGNGQVWRKVYANVYIDDHNMGVKALDKHGIKLPYKEDKK